jgi:ribose transport system permease protein|tara:strand:- start:1375 stop:2334 length:960 start_codon:yes stop_codon:yes gene_type:complete
MFMILLVLVLGFGLLSNNFVFFNYSNFFTIGLNASQLVLLSVGMCFLLGAGQLDLSIGSNLMLASVLSAMTITSLAGSPEQIASGLYPNIGIAVFCGVVVAIASGALFGLVNGLLVTRLNLSSFLITIATTAIGLGLTLVISRGVNVPYIPRSLQSEFAIKKLFGVAPYPVVLATLIVLLFWLILTTTRFGRHTIAIGSSEEAARRAGIQTDRHNVMLFVNMGVLAGVAALLDISRFAATNIGGHQTDALQAIAAAVIGGTSLFGGVASVIGAAIGTFIPAVLANGLIILRIDPFYQLIAVGMIIIVAVYIDQRNRSSR